MATELRPFDAAEYLNDAEDEADLLNAAVADGDHRYIAAALGAVARAHGGIGKLATATGIGRQTLHKALSTAGNPTLETVLKVIDALGLQIHIEPRIAEPA